MAVPDILLCFFPDCGKYQRFYHLSPSVSISVCFLVCDAAPVLVSVFAPVSTTALKCVLTPVPVPILGSSSSLHPCSRSSPRPVPSPVPAPITVQAPFTAPDTVHSFPPFELDYLLDKTRVYIYRTLRMEPVECPQAPLHVCRGNATCKKKRSCRKSKENRRQRRATCDPSARCWDSLECWSISRTCALPD